MDEEVCAGFSKLGTGSYSLTELGQAIAPGQSEKGRAALCQHLNDMKLRNLIALDGAGLYSVISVMVAPVVETTPMPAAKYPLPPPTPELVAAVYPYAQLDDPFPFVFPLDRFKPKAIPADDEPYAPTVDCGDDDDPFGTRGPGRPDVPPAQHAPDLQADHDAEHAACQARLNQEMAAAALAEAQAAETMPEPVAPRIKPVENAVVAAEPVVPAFPAETRQQLRVRVIAYLVGLPHRRFMPAAEIHAAIRPAMDVFDLNALLQYLGCNGEIEMSERGRREYEFCAHEPVEPLDAVGEPAVDSMAWLNEPYTWPDSTHTPSDDYDDVFSRPGEPDVPVQDSFESMKAKQQAARDAEHAAVIDRINQEMAQEATQAAKEAPCAYEHEEAPQAPAPGQEPAIHGLIREILKPGVAMPAGKLAPLVGATPHELYDALTGMDPEVRNYMHAGVSLWERRAA